MAQNGKVNGAVTVEGTVEARNERGLKVNGVWYNYSRFAQVAPPAVGQTVRLLVSGERWVKALEVLPEPEPQTAPTPDPERLALRRYALALAVRAVQPAPSDAFNPADLILEVATAFERWLTR